jgi:hypothetical protein
MMSRVLVAARDPVQLLESESRQHSGGHAAELEEQLLEASFLRGGAQLAGQLDHTPIE